MADYSLKDLIAKAKEKKGIKGEVKEAKAKAAPKKAPEAKASPEPMKEEASSEKPEAPTLHERGEGKAKRGEGAKSAIDELRELVGTGEEKAVEKSQEVPEATPTAEGAPGPGATPAPMPAEEAPPKQAQAAESKPAPAEKVTAKNPEDEKKAEEVEAKRQEEPKEVSAVEKEVQKAEKIEIARYKDVKVYKVPGKPLLYYFVPVPRPTASERAMISTIKEAATRVISIAPYKIRDPQQRRNVYYQKIMEILRSSPELNIPSRRFEFYANAVVREMVGYGMIDPLINDDNLEEIMVIGPHMPVFIFHREYEMMITNIEFYSDNEIQDLINRIARQIGRRVDISAPLLDARLPDGSRVNATIPPASVSGSTITIRKFRADPLTIIDLINYGTVTPDVAAFLWMCVEGLDMRPANILIAGGTGSGKTTLLNVLAAFVPATERIVSIEDTAELSLPLDHWIRLEARPPGLEGRGELTLDILTKNSLRMRPDRVIVGEIRHDEAFSLFTAMNTGHDGSLGTVHANSSQETIARVTSPPMNVPLIMLSGLNFVLVQQRIHDRKKGTIRRVTEVAEISGALGGKANSQTLYEYDPVSDKLVKNSVPSKYLKLLEKFTGMSKKQIEDEIKSRERLLKKLADNNIRSMADVSLACQDYLLQKRENDAGKSR